MKLTTEDQAKRRNPAGRLLSDRSGATAVEYGIIASLFILALIPALQSLGEATSGRRSAIHCAKQVLKHADNERRLNRIMSKRGACRRFV